ncbi:tryptophan synthase, alpha chain [Salinimicrobium catena]|uniref:Tryptophan synthase alpha chain n=1 Tax=Salinimicrobium catena TaxID=390640 RepID=A0A1H5NQM2_9FLAO|nr:tryptophan synthase subunit alpha [Salinimicrobium catena]SDL56339.1 tryptophan synthase, alpha chain [Salinimicrobium catena]SEF03107.1 tryptophan synthase, alpha chain [Salinimicrobium catena]
MNRIKQKLQEDPQKKLLSIYFTAGYPQPENTVPIIEDLEKSGVDMIEIGLPFSDPLADGPTIQESSQVALKNGMTTQRLFEQLKDIRKAVSIPLLIMGYFNPILQFGVEKFCQKCKETGIDGLIIPDLPVEEYLLQYKEIFRKYDLLPVFLITPQTSEERIRAIDSASEGFIYMVSSASVTGGTGGFGPEQKAYFERVSKMGLNAPLIVGFGIKDAETFEQATANTKGAIIGSAFIKHLTKHGTRNIAGFTRIIR